MNSLTEKEVIDVLLAIERGEVTIPKEHRDEASAAYCGDVEFTCSNGWRFVIFNDCDEWDYIAQVTAPDGRSLVFDDIWGRESDGYSWTNRAMPTLSDYSPPAHLSLTQWGIPT